VIEVYVRELITVIPIGYAIFLAFRTFQRIGGAFAIDNETKAVLFY
jgi:hypothetical protein